LHLLAQHRYQHVDGILFDLGVSSYQLDTAWRGFSFRHDGPLDMRMDTTQSTTAYTLVNQASAEHLDRLLSTLSGERWAKRIAHAIVATRRHGAIATTRQLAALVERTIPRAAWPTRVHPATRTFLALRMAVNDELPALAEALPQAVKALRSGGRLCLLTFHSVEHRQVKTFLHQEVRGCVCPPRLPICHCGRQPRLRLLHRKPLLPTADEIQANPRSRSAQLRGAEKLETMEECQDVV
jgi:16S rRNA (cytosine1402-N4)-methyltransferase